MSLGPFCHAPTSIRRFNHDDLHPRRSGRGDQVVETFGTAPTPKRLSSEQFRLYAPGRPATRGLEANVSGDLCPGQA